MRIEKTYLLPVHAQSDLGLIMLKMPVPVTKFYGKKVLVTLAPDSMQRADAGEVDVCLEASPEMTDFFSCDDVFAACGGTSGMKTWLINTRQNGCHLHHLCDDDYCHPEKTWWETPQNFLAAVEQMPPAKQDDQAEQLPIERTEKTVKRLNTDPEPPASFMLRPKRIRWICEKYTQWVKKQQCVCCGAQADDPHHLIGHGQGGTATKAHDMFTFPLCRQHHDELHRDPRAWARQYGSQLAHVIRTLDKALALGVIE